MLFVQALINNVFNFIEEKISEIKNLKNKYSLHLQRLSIYFSCNKIDDTVELEDELRDCLSKQYEKLLDLVGLMCLELHLSDLDNYRYSKESRFSSIAQGLMNLIPAKFLGILENFKYEKNIQRSFFLFNAGDEYFNYYQENNKKSELLSMLNEPWGVYIKEEDINIDQYRANRDITDENVEKFIDSFKKKYEFYKENVESMKSKIEKNNVGCIYNKNENCIFWNLINSSHHHISVGVRLKAKYDSLSFNTESFYLGKLMAQIYDFTYRFTVLSDSLWYNNAFDEYYYLFDNFRQNSEEFENIFENEINFYKWIFNNINKENDEKLKVLDIGVGYGRLEKKFIEGGLDLEIIGFDSSKIMIKFAKKSLPDVFSDIFKGEMHNIDYLIDSKYKGKINAAILTFTTFGYYPNDDLNIQTLEAVCNVLCDGGKIIIEQFLPPTKPSSLRTMVYDLTKKEYYELLKKEYERDDKDMNEIYMSLIKTSDFVPVSKNFAFYKGHYFYFKNGPNGKNLVKHHPYEIRLYTPEWFQENLKKIGFSDIKFYQNFETSPIDIDSSSFKKENRPIMICVAQKRSSIITSAINGSKTKKDDLIPPDKYNDFYKAFQNIIDRGVETENSELLKINTEINEIGDESIRDFLQKIEISNSDYQKIINASPDQDLLIENGASTLNEILEIIRKIVDKIREKQ